MRKSVPHIAKARITDVTTISKACKLLDLDYRNLETRSRAKLKQQVRNHELKATSDPAKIVEFVH